MSTVNDGRTEEDSSNLAIRNLSVGVYLNLIALLALAFSDDLVQGVRGKEDPGTVLWVDAALLAVITTIIALTQVRQARLRPREFGAWTLVAGAATLGLDALDLSSPESESPLGQGTDLVSASGYFLALAALALMAHGSTPTALVRRREKAARLRAILAAPYLSGMLSAYVASIYWGQVAERGDGIGQEYFAQVSQVIPLLAVAVGLEGRYLGRWRDRSREPGAAAALLTVLAISELLALSVLLVAPGTDLNAWHEYLATTVTAFAATASLAALVGAIMGASEEIGETDRRSISHQECTPTWSTQPRTEPSKLWLLCTGLVVVVWLALRRRRCNC